MRFKLLAWLPAIAIGAASSTALAGDIQRLACLATLR